MAAMTRPHTHIAKVMHLLVGHRTSGTFHYIELCVSAPCDDPNDYIVSGNPSTPSVSPCRGLLRAVKLSMHEMSSVAVLAEECCTIQKDSFLATSLDAMNAVHYTFMRLQLQACVPGRSAGVTYFAILVQFVSVMLVVVIMQGTESNVRHHRYFIPMVWGEQRQDDYFKDFPHGGRLDMRFTRSNNVNGSVYSHKNLTLKSPAGYYSVEAMGTPACPMAPVPMQHYSHMLNYDYFKVNQPYVRHLLICALQPAVS
jgi:hypothetical protein